MKSTLLAALLALLTACDPGETPAEGFVFYTVGLDLYGSSAIYASATYANSFGTIDLTPGKVSREPLPWRLELPPNEEGQLAFTVVVGGLSQIPLDSRAVKIKAPPPDFGNLSGMAISYTYNAFSDNARLETDDHNSASDWAPIWRVPTAENPQGITPPAP